MLERLVTRRVALLRKLITINLATFNSVDNYVSQIVSTAQRSWGRIRYLFQGHEDRRALSLASPPENFDVLHWRMGHLNVNSLNKQVEEWPGDRSALREVRDGELCSLR